MTALLSSRVGQARQRRSSFCDSTASLPGALGGTGELIRVCRGRGLVVECGAQLLEGLVASGVGVGAVGGPVSGGEHFVGDEGGEQGAGP
ncbi:MAG: hypothetical protein QOH09_3830 [Pseudonocardiales bacterium]|nr:hypothetical protein [Pseudonocardiales bacterium]